MMRKSTESASREWSGTPPTPEAVQTPPLGFGVPRRSAIVPPILGHLGNLG